MAGMAAGTLDRRITFERRVVTRDTTYGTSVETWVPHVKVWAQVQDVLPSRAESIDQSNSIQRRPARVRTRYRSDVTGDMRINYAGRILRIIAGPVEIGRRDGLEMMVEELSTEGQEP